MSISAAQLISEVKIIGVDTAQASLLSMGAASDAADVSLAAVADSSAVLGGSLGILGEQTITAGVGFDDLAVSAADATGVLAASVDATTVSMGGFVGAVDLGALSTEEYVAYITESSLALGLWEEFTTAGIVAQNELSASMGGVVVSSEATTASLAGMDVALADTSMVGAGASGSMDGVAASEEAVGAASGKVALGLGVLALAAVVAAGASVKMAADYQQSMLKVQSLTGATDDQMKQFDSGLKQLSEDTGVAPKKLSDGLYNVISAGYQGKDAMTVLALATKDATIGMTDAKVTTDALTNVMAQFSVGASGATRVNGEMLETVTLGKSTFEQYANSIVKSAGAASQFHVSMETMNAAFATMTSSGIKAAQASTDFQASLKVMDGNIGAVTKSLNKSGIAFDQTKFNAMDYGHQVVYLNDALQQANEKHVKVTGVTIQAAQAIQTIASHISTYNSDLATLSDKQAMAAKTQEAWSVTSQGFNVSLDRLKATAQVVMIDLGTKLLPIATWGVNALSTAMQAVGPIVQDVSNYFSKFDLTGISYAWKQLTGAVQDLLSPLKANSDVMGALAPYLTSLRNGFSQLLDAGIRNIAGFITNIATAVKGLSQGVSVEGLSSLGDVFKQLGPAVKTLASAIGGELGKELKTVGGDLQQFGSWFSSSVMPAIKEAMPGFLNLANTLLNTVGPAFVTIRGVVFDVIQHAFETFGPIIGKIVPPLIKFAGVLANDVANGLKFIMPYVTDAAKAIGKFADDIMTRVAPIVEGWIKGLTPLVQTFMAGWQQDWPMISGTLKASWEAMSGIVKVAWALISGYVKIGLDVMSGNWGQAWTDLKDTLSGVWDGIKTYLKGVMDETITLIRPLVEALSHVPGPAGDMARGVLNAFDGMKDGAVQKTAEMKGKVLDNTAQMHVAAAKELDGMRQDILGQLENTKDPAKKHALEMKLAVVTHAEDMHVEAASKAESMKREVVNHVKDMKDQSQGGIAGVGKYFADRFTEAKNGVTEAFGSVGHWFQDRWKDIQNIWGGVGKWFQDRWADISKAWQTGVNNVVGFFTYLYDHSTLFQKIVDGIRGAFNTIVNDIQGAWKFVSGWLVHEWETLVKSSNARWNEISKAIHDGWNVAVKFITDIWTTISSVFSSAWTNYISKPLTALWTTVSTFFSNTWTNYVSKPLTSLWTTVSTFFSNVWTNYVSKPISDLWTSLSTTVSGWATDAWTWGVNLITGLANGITNAVGGALHTALDGAATAIKNVVGWHSPTKEGPGADSDKWAPNLVNMMSTGLEAGIPKIESAVSRLAKPIALTLNPVNNASFAAGIRNLPTNATALPAGASSIPGSFSNTASSTASAPVIHIHNYIDGKEMADNTATRIVKSTRTNGPIRSSIS